jgi:hypothetical protein
MEGGLDMLPSILTPPPGSKTRAKQQHREHHAYHEGSPVSDRFADANHFDQLSLSAATASSRF